MKYIFCRTGRALEETAIWVVDETGQIMKEAGAASAPEARDAPFEPLPAAGANRIGSLPVDGIIGWRVESHRLAGDLH